MRELAGAGAGEIHAVAGTQPAHLSDQVRAVTRKIAVLVQKAFPYIDEGDAGLFSPFLEDVVDEREICPRFRTADRRQPDPQHRHALRLQCSDDLVDALAVKLDPFFGAEL